MAYFAELDSNNTVIRSVLISNEVILNAPGIENEQLGIDLCKSLFGADTVWKQTSRNTKDGIHYDSQTNKPDNGFAFRKNFAQQGMIYDPIKDEFNYPSEIPGTNPPE
jgi:hypothetical protein